MGGTSDVVRFRSLETEDCPRDVDVDSRVPNVNDADRRFLDLREDEEPDRAAVRACASSATSGSSGVEKSESDKRALMRLLTGTIV